MLPPATSGSVSSNSVRDRLQVCVRVAMKAGDKASVKAFRSALSAIANSEAVDATEGPPRVAGPTAGGARGLGAGEVPRAALTELDMLDIVDGEIASLAASAAQYDATARRPQPTRSAPRSLRRSRCSPTVEAPIVTPLASQ